MDILSPEQIKHPTGSYIHKDPDIKDWVRNHPDPILGANVQRTVLCPDKNWVPYVTEYELQRNNIFDPYDCVTQGLWNGIQCLAKKQFNLVLNESKRYTAIKSGTVPRQGNDLRTVAECIRTKGCVDETVYPTMTPDMTENQFFQPIPPDVDQKENFLKGGYSFNHEYLYPPYFSGQSVEGVVEDALQYSPLAVAIEGHYSFDAQGRLQFSNQPYSHVVLIVSSQPDCFLVVDSENPQGLMRVRRDYPFASIKALYLKKKTNMLYKKNGEAAIYVKHWSQDLLIPFSDGSLAGGDVFKTLYGITDYSQLNITHVDTLPYPVASYGITTK